MFWFPSVSIAVMFHVSVASVMIASSPRVMVPVEMLRLYLVLLKRRYASWMVLLSTNCVWKVMFREAVCRFWWG